MAIRPDIPGLIFEDDPQFQQTGLLGLDPGVAVDPKQYSYLKSAYDYYLGGGMLPEETTPVDTGITGDPAEVEEK